VRRATTPLVAAIAAVAIVIGLYVVLGGASYVPTPVVDPCTPRVAAPPAGVSQTVEHVALAAIDDAACQLGVGREELVLALRSEETFAALAATTGRSQDDVERTIKEALVEAIGEADEDGELPGLVASLARNLIERVPPWLVFEAIERIGNLIS
jgi:hypothetical protein